MKTKETKAEHVCEFCGHSLTEEEIRNFNNVELCESCYNSRVTHCDCCGTLIWREAAEGNEDDDMRHRNPRKRIMLYYKRIPFVTKSVL